MGSISVSLPDKTLGVVKRIAEARELSPEAWIREAVTIAIAAEVLPAEREDPAPAPPPAAALSEWSSVGQLAEYLNVSSRHLYNLISSGRLGSVRVGTLVRIRRDQVERYLEQNTKEVKT